jgi:hypothetical protein
MQLITVREYHVAPDGHQYSIKERLFHFMEDALAFISSYKGTGILDLIED